jgi:hypothetical protein
MRYFTVECKRRADIQTVVEVGVCVLEFTKELLWACDRVIGVDPYVCWPEGTPYYDDPANGDDQKEQDDRYNLAAFIQWMEPRLQLLRLTSEQAAETCSVVVDAVYLDGNHDYKFVKQDIELWLPHIRPGGIIGGHDYERSHPGVIAAVDEAFGDKVKTLQNQGCDWLVYL